MLRVSLLTLVQARINEAASLSESTHPTHTLLAELHRSSQDDARVWASCIILTDTLRKALPLQHV